MDVVDLSYLMVVGLVGAGARAISPALPEAWRLRLEAEPPPLAPGWVWIHAVSVGELLLADGLLARLRERGHWLHVTTSTPAGLALLHQRLPSWDQGTGRLTGSAFPLDDPVGLAPFLRVPPAAFIALETELWPGLIRVLEALGVPRLVVNGRLTERSLARGGPWLRKTAGRLTWVAARDANSLAAFETLGAPRVELGGNLKADAPPPRKLHGGWEVLRRAWASSPVVVAGNTLEGEEGLVLEAWDHAARSHAGLKLILAPRQPRRFDAVAQALRDAGKAFLRASEPWPTDLAPWEATEILLLDTLGELAAAYGEGDVALVGGGWGWHGGHNPLESVRWGIPTLLGPGYENFEDLVTPLLEAGLVTVVDTDNLARGLCEQLQRYRRTPEATWGVCDLPAELCGTLDRTFTHMMPFLPEP